VKDEQQGCVYNEPNVEFGVDWASMGLGGGAYMVIKYLNIETRDLQAL